jgi:hypothetical protein
LYNLHLFNNSLHFRFINLLIPISEHNHTTN